MYSTTASDHSIRGFACWITGTLEVGTFAGEANLPPVQLAAADSGDDRDRRPVVDRGTEALEEGDALVADEDVHVPAELTLLREHAVDERGPLRGHLAER